MTGSDRDALALADQVVTLQRRRIREGRALRWALMWTWLLVAAAALAAAFPDEQGWLWIPAAVLFVVAWWRTTVAVPWWSLEDRRSLQDGQDGADQ